MNFYGSADYLDLVRDLYFPGKSCEVRDYDVEGRVFRLLSVEGAPLVRQPFLDVHEPLVAADRPQPAARLAFLPGASHGLVPTADFQAHYLPVEREGEAPTPPERLTPSGDLYLAAPTVVWAGVESWDAYLALLKSRSSLVKDDQRRRRRMGESLGELRFTVHDPSPDVLPFCFENKSAQMVETLGLDIFADERNKRFFPALDERGLLKATTLRAGDRLLAAWLGVIWDDVWTGWIYTYDHDPELKKHSIGRQLLYFMLEESLRLGHREFDFSIGDEFYKFYFSTHARAVGPLGTPPVRDRVKKRLKAAVKEGLTHAPWLEGPAREALKRVRSLRS